MKAGQFVVLSIYEVHMASAALMIDGKVIAAAHEERFSRLKNDVGFPLRAAKFCLEKAGISPHEVDVVAFANKSFSPDMIAKIMFKRYATFGIDDYVAENEAYWKPVLIEKKNVGSYFDVMGGHSRVVANHNYDFSSIDLNAPPDVVSAKFDEIRKTTVAELLGISKEKVRFFPNYMCHLYHAYYSGHLRGSDVLVLDVEGEGEGYNAVAARHTTAGFEIISQSNECMLGRIYQWMTLVLGMKPYHHEFKLMGLAPWANEREVRKSYKIFESILKIDHEEMLIRFNQRPSDFYYHFRDVLQGHRFDGIAGAVQHLVETYLEEWIGLILSKTGLRKVCYAGGVAMNVKANMKLAMMESIDDLYVPLSPGDESTVFGVGYWATEEHFRKIGRDPESIPALEHAYWGAEYGINEINRAVKEANIADRFQVHEMIQTQTVASLLARGNIVARFQGRSEFGQRALGNRSILADPSLQASVNKINTQIKYRDFWMPFAPTILDSRQHDYLKNPKNLSSPFMTVGFPVQKCSETALAAAIHPGDQSARPQILTHQANPAYYDLIKKFEEMTGIGALLNTSFNLHGEPNVDSPQDAIHTFINSELDALWMGDILISRVPLEGEEPPSTLGTMEKT